MTIRKSNLSSLFFFPSPKTYAMNVEIKLYGSSIWSNSQQHLYCHST